MLRIFKKDKPPVEPPLGEALSRAKGYADTVVSDTVTDHQRKGAFYELVEAFDGTPKLRDLVEQNFIEGLGSLSCDGRRMAVLFLGRTVTVEAASSLKEFLCLAFERGEENRLIETAVQSLVSIHVGAQFRELPEVETEADAALNRIYPLYERMRVAGLEYRASLNPDEYAMRSLFGSHPDGFSYPGRGFTPFGEIFLEAIETWSNRERKKGEKSRYLRRPKWL